MLQEVSSGSARGVQVLLTAICSGTGRNLLRCLIARSGNSDPGRKTLKTWRPRDGVQQGMRIGGPEQSMGLGRTYEP